MDGRLSGKQYVHWNILHCMVLYSVQYVNLLAKFRGLQMIAIVKLKGTVSRNLYHLNFVPKTNLSGYFRISLQFRRDIFWSFWLGGDIDTTESKICAWITNLVNCFFALFQCSQAYPWTFFIWWSFSSCSTCNMYIVYSTVCLVFLLPNLQFVCSYSCSIFRFLFFQFYI